MSSQPEHFVPAFPGGISRIMPDMYLIEGSCNIHDENVLPEYPELSALITTML